MKDLLARFVPERHELILDRGEVMNAIEVINEHSNNIAPEMRLNNCGWADDPNRWFILFTTTGARWNEIRDKLKVVRMFDIKDIPKNTTGVVYTTD